MPDAHVCVSVSVFVDHVDRGGEENNVSLDTRCTHDVSIILDCTCCNIEDNLETICSSVLREKKKEITHYSFSLFEMLSNTHNTRCFP